MLEKLWRERAIGDSMGFRFIWGKVQTYTYHIGFSKIKR